MAKATTTRGPGVPVKDANAPVLASDVDIDAEDENGSYVYVGRFDACAVRLTAIAKDASTDLTISIEGAEDSSGTNGRVLGAFHIRDASETDDLDLVMRLSNVWLPYMRWAVPVYTGGGFSVGDLLSITVHQEYSSFTDTEDSGVPEDVS